MLRVPGFVIPSAASFTAQLGVFVIWFIFPFYIGDVIGRDAVSMGTLFAVMAVLQMASSSGGGWLCDRVGPIWVGTTGVTVITLGMVYLGFLTATSTLLEVGLGIAIIGAGMGSFQAAAYTYMMSSVATERLSTAASALSLCQSSGTVLSVAVMGGVFALFQSYYRSGFGGEGVSAGATETDVFMLAFRALFWVGAGADGGKRRHIPVGALDAPGRNRAQLTRRLAGHNLRLRVSVTWQKMTNTGRERHDDSVAKPG